MNRDQLEDSLSHPTDAVIEALSGLDGDLVVLGAGGKMGPSLVRMARRALDGGGSRGEVHAVSRFSRPGVREALDATGVRTLSCDLLDAEAIAELPDASAVIFMAGTKFGTGGAAATTWALNAWLPGVVGERYRGVPTVVFSSGNVYPFVAVEGGGATEETEPAPVGEYAWSVLARERMFEHFAATAGTPVLMYRLNYAAELRYGVPLDIATRVWRNETIELSMGYFNVIWQGDANAAALASLPWAGTPPAIVNVTGPETVSVRALATRFGELLEREPLFSGSERETALLSNATKARQLFGPPQVELESLVRWVADWVRSGGETLGRPTHYEVRDGGF